MPLTGATTFAAGYGGGSYASAAGVFDGYVGLPLAATKQKWYLSEGTWPSSSSTNYTNYQTLAAAPPAGLGCKMVLCIKPLRTGVGNSGIAASEITNLQNVIALYKPYEVCLWNEFNGGTGSPIIWWFNYAGNNTAEPTYLQYVNTYASAVASACAAGGAAFVINPDGSYMGNAVDTLLTLPGGLSVPYSKGYVDWYGNHSIGSGAVFPDQNPSGCTTSVFAIFDSWGIAAGLGEWGMASGSTSLTTAQWNTYTTGTFPGGNSGILGIFQGRLAAGKPCADIAYYSGQTSSGVNNVTGTSDMKVAGIRQVSGVFTSQSGFVQNVAQGSATTTGTTVTATLGSGITTTVGHTLVLYARGAAGRKLTGVTDSGGNTWQVDAAGTSAAANSGIASCRITTALTGTGPSTITATFSGTASALLEIGIAEISGIAKTSAGGVATDQAVNAHFATATPTAATAAAGQAADFVFSAAASGASGSTFTVTSPDPDSGGAWNRLGYVSAGLDAAWQAGGAASLYEAEWSATGSPASTDACIVTYKALPVITTPSLPGGTVGVAYSQAVAGAQGDGAYTWTVSSGSLPPGLGPIGATTGTIAGTPTTASSTPYAFTVTLTDAGGNTTSQAMSIAVAGTALAVTTTGSLPGGTEGTPYSQTAAATGGATPYTWNLYSGTLPPGLAGVSTQAASPWDAIINGGTPTAAGTFTFVLQVTDSNGTSANSGTLSITITTPGLLQAVTGGSTDDYGLSSVQISTSPGSLIAVFAGWDLHNGVTTAPVPAVYPSDSTASNIWYHLGTSSSGGYGCRSAIWVCPNAQPVEWVSCSLTAYASSLAYVVCEFSGLPALFDPDLSVSGFVNLGIPSVEYLAGAGNWAPPAGITSVEAECWGAGGPGAAGARSNHGGGAGGGGAYSAEPSLAVSGTCAYGQGIAHLSGNGPASFFTGSAKTVTAAGGGAASGTTGGTGGATSSSTVSFAGGDGGDGGTQSQNAAGGSGGGSGGTASAGNDGYDATKGTGAAATPAVTGGGPGGAGGRAFDTPHQGQPPATGPGGGGGGGSLSDNSVQPGAAGADGQIRVTYVTSPQTLALSGSTSGLDVAFAVFAAGSTSVSLSSAPAGWSLAATSSSAMGADGVQVWAYFNLAVPGATVLAPSWTVSAAAPLSGVLGAIGENPPEPVQPNPAFPVLRVEAAFGFTPGDPSASPPSWTDITNRAIGKDGTPFITPSAGRQYELSSPEAGEMVIGINNADGAFLPGNTASPYFPDVAVGTPVRVAAWWEGSWYAVAYGYVERWPQDWPDLPQWGLSAMTATDAIAVLNSVTMPSALQGDILLDGPVVFLPMGEQYLSYSNGLSSSGVLNSYSDAEAAGLIAANISRVNQQPGAYTDGILQGVSTTVATGSNGGEISNIANWTTPAAGTLAVASTGGFTTSGTLNVAASGSTTAVVTYTGTTKNTFTGCAYVSGSATGTVATGGSVVLPATSLQAATGQAMNLLGDQGTGFGLSSLSGNVTYGNDPVTGPGVIYTGPDLPSPLSPDGVSVEAWFVYDIPSGSQSPGQGITLIQAFSCPSSYWPTSTADTGAGAGPLSFSVQVNSATGNLELLLNDGTVVTYPFTPSAAAQQVVVAFSTAPSAVASAYLNGVHLGDTDLTAGQATAWTAVIFGPATFAYSSDPLVQNFTVSDGAVYPYYLPAARAASHYNTGSLGAAGGSVSQGTAQVLSWGYLGIPRGGPATFSGVTDGIAMGPFYDLGGTSAADGVNQLVVNDGGMVFAAPTGVLTVLPRWALFGLSPQITFGDATDGSEVPYLQGQGFDYDNTYLYNITSVTREDGPDTSITATTVNTPSQLEYFTRAPRTVTTTATSDLDAYTTSQWSNAAYAQPQLRVRSLTVDASATQQFTAVLTTGVGDVVTVNRRPVGGAVISGQFIVQKVSHAISPAGWRTTYQISPYVLEAQVLQLDTGQNTLGGTVLS